MFPEFLAQRFSGKYIGDACTPILLVIRRNRDRRPREWLGSSASSPALWSPFSSPWPTTAAMPRAALGEAAGAL